MSEEALDRERMRAIREAVDIYFDSPGITLPSESAPAMVTIKFLVEQIDRWESMWTKLSPMLPDEVRENAFNDRATHSYNLESSARADRYADALWHIKAISPTDSRAYRYASEALND